MKKLMMMMAMTGAVLGVATSALAQNAGPKTGGGLQQGKQGKDQGAQGQRGMMRAKLQKEVLAKLNLSAAQKSKWEAVTTEMRAEMTKMRDTSKSDAKPDRKAMAEKLKGYQDKYMAILTPKQQDEYKKLMEEAVAKMKKDNGGGTTDKKAGGKKGGGGGF